MGKHFSATNRLLAAGVLSTLLVGISSCSASDNKSSSAQTVASAKRPTATAATVAAASDAAASGAGGVALEEARVAPGSAVGATGVALPELSPFGRALAVTASVTVVVPDVRKAIVALPDLVTAKRGVIFNTDIQVGDPKTAVAIVTIKVPPDDIESLVSGLGGLGDLLQRSQQTEEVGSQISDVQSRLLTAQASVSRVRALLAGATDLNDIVKIEGELTVRETTLEQLLSSQRNLNDRVQLATLTVTLRPAPESAVKIVPVNNDTSVGGAFGTGWKAFTAAIHGIVVAFAYAAPFLLIALIGGLVALLARRRTRPGRVSGPVAEPIA